MTALGLVLSALLGACGESSPPAAPLARPPVLPLTHDAYIWQRVWKEPLKAALADSAKHVRAWHVLAGEIDAKGRLQMIRVDFAALATTGRPVIPVVRIEGALPGRRGITEVAALIRHWQMMGTLAGVEIDHDSGARQLSAYAAFLTDLRAAIDPQLPLSITLLPDWLDAPELSALLSRVDDAVLQLHGLPAFGHSVFDPARARLWTQRMQSLGKPFRVALPNYGSRITTDEQGRIIAVESEMPIAAPEGQTREVFASPPQLASFLDLIERSRPHTLYGIVWFRLPVDSDLRTWSRNTWHALIGHRNLHSQLHAEWRPYRGKRRHGEFVLSNRGEIDAEYPERLVADIACRSPASSPYFLEMNAADNGTLLVRARKGLLRAGATITVASAICDRNTRNLTVRIED